MQLLTSTIETYREFQDSLKASENAYFNKRYAVTAYPLSEIRRILLPANETLIEYTLTENHLYTFVLTADSFYTRRTNINHSSAIASLQKPQHISVTEFRDSAYKLYTELIKPIEGYFASNHLIIIPDEDLYYLNFETLVSDSTARDFGSLDYLIRKYSISNLLSANVAAQMKKYNPAENSNDKALLFSPVFTDSMKRNYVSSVEPMQVDSSYLYLFRQPFALQAVRDIHKLISADMYIENDALESSFKKSSPQYKVLHLATHAQVSDIDPLQSRLFFAKQIDHSVNADDGNLNAYEIYSMQLQAELAVLTACETGLGQVHTGEGVISLAHSFMFAGCPSVVMSLWKIDEKTNAHIITDFYGQLKKGHRKSEALRKSQTKFYEK